MESSEQPLHVCSVVELDPSTIPGGYTFDRFRDDLASRIKALPEFRAKLADTQLNLDHPVWVEDKDFDLSHHLHRMGVPSPGGRENLADVCAQIASVPLDRSTPLWEMWVADDQVRDGGPLALMIKVHHAAVDGVTAANLLRQLCSSEPDPPVPDAVDGPGDATWFGIAGAGVVRFLARPAQLARVLPTTMSTIVTTVNRARSGTAMAAPFTAATASARKRAIRLKGLNLTSSDLGVFTPKVLHLKAQGCEATLGFDRHHVAFT